MKRSCSSTPPDSSSSSSKPQIEYDVFLSFRGEDSRNTFTSHLYEALCQKGIYTFKDNLLPRGQSISPELLKAIESSRCSVIVLSRNYASSSWCLDELVKILECKEEYKQIVLPIFYHVDPSHVRKQLGSIGKAFETHELNYSTEKVQSWRDALTQVANLSGDPLHDGDDEAQFIQKFIQEVSRQLGVVQLKNSEGFFDISEGLFGMESRLKKLNNCVCNSSLNDVRFIGICEMGGIGKTTLARTYYEGKSSQFDSSSFLANIREACEKKNDGLVHLQNRLLSHILNGFPNTINDVDEGIGIISKRLCHKKVLIVLDDVDQLEQLEALAGKRNWFGSGSRILITTRDESLLKSTYKDQCEIYRPEHLHDNEGLQLFSWKAFKSTYPPEDYKQLSQQVIKYAKGLPLALKVLGSFLCGKEIDEWKSALDRLKEYPEKKIVKVLRLTFEALEETEKSIFLDIACFFNGWDKDEIIQIMDSCGFHPIIGIKTLLDKSLLHKDPDNNSLGMHDLLQEMGREIVREKSRNQPGRWSRLWNYDDICQVLNNNKGTEEVEAIVCRDPLHVEALSKMKKLRLLIIEYYNECPNCDITPIAYLSNELRILKWYGFPFTSLPSSFQPDQLVELTLYGSKIEQLWNNTTKPLYNLKIINLGYSVNIRKLEDFKVVPNLEELILWDCYNLVEIHPSITLLTRLTLLDLSGCTRLENFPTSISGLKRLKVLKLKGCESLKSLPEDLGHLNSLEELELDGSNLRNSESGEATLNIFVGKGFCSLKKLDLQWASSCLGGEAIPEDFAGCLASLEELTLSGATFSSLPASVNQLSKLRILDLTYCKELKSLGPELPPSLEFVRVDSCYSLETFLDPLPSYSASCFECYGLVRRQGCKKTAIAPLKRYLQSPHNRSKFFFIYLPGHEIPAWFTHRSVGRSISIKVDPNWCSSKWMGFAFSLILDSFEYPNSVTIYVQDLEFHQRVQFINSNFWSSGLRDDIDFEAHLGLIYLPRDMCDHTKWQNNCSALEFTFQFQSFVYYGEENYEYGVRLVYEQDIQDLNLHSEDEDEDEDIVTYV